MNLSKLVLIIGSALTFAGCTATGKSYSEFMTQPEATPRNGQAKAIVYRTTDSLFMSARAARIKLNGNEVASCDRGGFVAIDLPVGSNTLSVDIWDAPGICATPASAKPNSIVYYEVKPRSSGMAALMAGGLIGGAIEGEKFCSGPFEIKEVSPATAKSALPNLKLSQ